MAKRSKEASKLAPYLGGHSGAPVEGSFGGDLQAVINALNAHKLGDDHEKFDHIWSGLQQFLQTMVTASILPSLADSYDIGSDTRRFRKGFFSELSSLVFKKDNVIVLDGRLVVSKMAGVLPGAVLITDTSIDFGETMIPGDILVMRSDGNMEYIQVGALLSGTTYTVTRDLDGSGANDWPEGEPFAVLGSEGDGWIEISAVDEKRFSVFVMGATFNSAVEIARYGEITGWQTAGFSGVGLAFGNFATGKYLISTDVDGLAAVGLSLKIGSGEKDVDLTGIQIDDTEIVGQNNGVDQVVIGADGKLKAGAGKVLLDNYGLKFFTYGAGITFFDNLVDQNLRGYLQFLWDPKHPTINWLALKHLAAIQIIAPDIYLNGTVRGKNISETPTANYIPKADSDGKLPGGWIPDLKSTYVDLSSAQTVAGVKTFSSIPVLPSSNPTTDNQAVRKAYADDTFLGILAKATSAEVTAGTDDAKYVTSKAIQDSFGFTAVGRALLDDATLSDQRNTLKLKQTPLLALSDNSATSITPTNSSGFLLMRLLANGSYALVTYDAISGVAYATLMIGSGNVAVTTGVLSGTTGTDGKLTISAHTDGKIYFENRLGSTVYIGYVAI